MKATQCDKVLEYMRRFGSITKLEALEDIGCKNLTSRISALRSQGIAIGWRMAYGKNRNGDDVRYAKYYLIEDE